MHWPIIRRLALSPTRTVLTDDRKSWRAIELLVGSTHLAAKLDETSRSRTVGLLLPTSGVFPLAALAAWSLGKVVVPLNYLLKREELQFVINDCGCDTVVTVGPMLDHLGYEPDCQHLLRLESLNFKGVPPLRMPAMPADDELAVLMYTSGTSGNPKGVMLTHGNIRANIEQIERWVHFTTRDTLLGVLPQFHSFGLTVLTLLPLSVGCGLVYTARFVPSKLVKLIREQRPSVLVLIPSMYAALLSVKDATPEDFSSLRYVVSGAEPLPRSVLEGFRQRFNVTINEGYGLTETAPVSNWCKPEMFRPGSVGPALPGITQRIVCLDTGRDLPPGREGEVRIGGPNVMQGYYNRPEESAAAFDQHGHLRTGDIGRLDDEGHLFLTGRLKEMLIVGGENVFPREIEEVLCQHPTVRAAGVVGLPDDLRGEVPIAFVEPEEGASCSEKELISWCRERLAGYKVPREVRVLEALPRNPTGKVMRRELKRLVLAEQAAQG